MDTVIDFLFDQKIPGYDNKNYIRYGVWRQGIEYPPLYRPGMTLKEAAELVNGEYVQSLYQRQRVIDHLVAQRIPWYTDEKYVVSGARYRGADHVPLYKPGMTIEQASHLALLIKSSVYRGPRPTDPYEKDFIEFCEKEYRGLTIPMIVDQIETMIARFRTRVFRTKIFGDLDERTNAIFKEGLKKIFREMNTPGFNQDVLRKRLYDHVLIYFPDETIAEQIFAEVLELWHANFLDEIDSSLEPKAVQDILFSYGGHYETNKHNYFNLKF